MTMQRMWINQPSTLQPLHHLHGTRVLGQHESATVTRIYFLSGDVISQQAPREALSEGWPARKTSEPSLYYLSGDDQNGDSMTLFVVANTPTHAHQIWKEHWEDDSIFLGPVIRGQPTERVEDKLIIYELDYDPDTIGAIPWQDLELVAYVDP
ncbi:hypothetical protein IB276_33165 [Ensifer sp. ENS04]|uniref:hypothetical protein n=1 Tax=Ensifer sp. ENS04 TaxID=2769281 RepID=UPI00178216E5|nr:hypothetical protein [Ensifer sp. ENS04]MBD9544298.1 hypothetical protein [Ensifer sp. ENS04]